MARTIKDEFTRPAGQARTLRIARKARPAGRIIAIIEEELAAEEG